ncbi:flagellin [Geobacillus sp. NFOSA3]|nr:flagellin [Geobacillus sp. NFOSA3]
MRINHNIAALNTYRQLTIGQNAAAKNMEKLSSGLRINRAGDDAAGLAISEKMRGQIRGLEMASKNAQDGISLIQTAEGALNETHAILQRMRELAVQAANDTNTATDRAELQKEVDQLSQELSRIGTTTEFNTQKLLDGSFSGIFHIGANEGQNLSLQINDMRGFALGVAGSISTTNSSGNATTLTNNGLEAGTYVAKKQDITIAGTTHSNQDVLVDESGNVVAVHISDGKYYSINDVEDNGSDGLGAKTGANALFTGSTLTDDGSTPGALTVDTKVVVGGIDISSQSAANSAITTINNAIERVSAERAKLGAYQNRLEHTINNLGTSAENLTAAESRIRDVDYALVA